MQTTFTTLLQLLALGLAVGTAAWTLTKATIFERPRDWIDTKSEWFGNLVHCPYCTSHWLALGAVLIYQPVVMSSGLFIVDLLMSTLIVVAFSAFTGGLIYRAFRSPQPEPANDEQEPAKAASFLSYDKK